MTYIYSFNYKSTIKIFYDKISRVICLLIFNFINLIKVIHHFCGYRYNLLTVYKTYNKLIETNIKSFHVLYFHYVSAWGIYLVPFSHY